MSKLISSSPNCNAEYCCNIIQIGTLEDIEGSDFLAKTYLNGDSIVVRKDQVHEGDYFFYAMNESALNKHFLSVNNLFEIGEAERNANYEVVKPLLDKSAGLKAQIEKIEKTIKSLNRARRLYDARQDMENSRKKANSILTGIRGSLIEGDVLMNILNEIKELNVKKDELAVEREATVAEAKKHVGFFNKHGRVRCIKLKGTPSYGFIFSLDEMVKVYPEMEGFDMASHLGEDFDTVCGDPFVTVYVPPVQPTSSHKRGSGVDKAQKRAERFDRMVPGEFAFHYDTQPLGKNMWKLQPDDVVVIDNKIHGSSAIMANIKVKYPIKNNIFKRAINALMKLFHKDIVFPEYYIDYGNVYSSRKVIKNKDLNPNKGSDYYSSDIWGYWNNLIKDYIEPGMTIYSEIYGYTPDGKFIQDKYDYGCKPGESKMTPYRITVTDEATGVHVEWNKEDVYNWTVDLINRVPELQGKLVPVDIFYHGRFRDLYPHIKADLHWHENVLRAMQEDQETFGMEQLEPLCVNPVPREGLVIRKDDDNYPEAWKLKTDAFRTFERKQIDAGIVDGEMAEGYGAEEETGEEPEMEV